MSVINIVIPFSKSALMKELPITISKDIFNEITSEEIVDHLYNGIVDAFFYQSCDYDIVQSNALASYADSFYDNDDNDGYELYTAIMETLSYVSRSAFMRCREGLEASGAPLELDVDLISYNEIKSDSINVDSYHYFKVNIDDGENV